GLPARNHSFKDIRVTDALDAAQCLLTFQTVNDRLNGGVSWPVRLGKRFLDFPDGARTLLPECVQHLQFQLRESWSAHIGKLRLHLVYYYHSRNAKVFSKTGSRRCTICSRMRLLAFLVGRARPLLPCVNLKINLTCAGTCQ